MELAIGIIVAVLVIGAAVAIGLRLQRSRHAGTVVAVDGGTDQRGASWPDSHAPNGEERSI